MKFSISTFLVGTLPVAAATACYFNSFDVDTGAMLNLFLPLVWGILFALGGSIVYLNNHKFDIGRTSGKFLNAVTDHTKSFSLILIAHCLIFVALGVLYPARFFIKTLMGMNDVTFNKIRIWGDCLLFSSIVVPALFSVVVGGFCLFISFNQHKVIKTPSQ